MMSRLFLFYRSRFLESYADIFNELLGKNSEILLFFVHLCNSNWNIEDMIEHKYGMLTYPAIRKNVNVGDFIQSLAAKQFLPQADVLIDREKLSLYAGNPVKMIMNGWYMTNPKNWPPSDLIDPLFVSFHINETVEDSMLSEQSVEYLKKHEPIGCRDYHTSEILGKAGIKAYFSGCLTLTLGKSYKRRPCSGEIIFVDVLNEFSKLKDLYKHPRITLEKVRNGLFFDGFFKHSLMRKMFSKSLLKNAVYLEQTVEMNGEDLFDYTDRLLKRLAAAKFVVTSRIHIALPCLAMGVPVIFVNGGLYLSRDIYRLGGLVDLMNQIHIDRKHNISANFDVKFPITEDFVFENRNSYLKYAESLSETCEKFLST